MKKILVDAHTHTVASGHAYSIHSAWYKGGTKEENTQGMINVIRHPKIHIISHPTIKKITAKNFHANQLWQVLGNDWPR